MFEKIRKMKNQKGFTLVELIVVLVILAILAAMLVPALTGYIDKANNEKIIAATRQVVMAAQTEVSEAYASNTLTKTTITITKGSNDDKPSYDPTANEEVAGEKIVKLAEVATVDDSSKKCTFKNDISEIKITYEANGHVSQVVLKQGTKTCTYMEGTLTGNYDYSSGNYGVKK